MKRLKLDIYQKRVINCSGILFDLVDDNLIIGSSKFLMHFRTYIQNNISREAQTMVLVDHPNVLKSHCSFVSDHNLWVIMPYMAGGSCLHILKAAHPDGFEETVIATVLREVLKGLEYLHHHGFIHRDVKAGNILIDARGGIKLGDFGVSAYLFDSGDRQRMRNTFVGTPCWYALTQEDTSGGFIYLVFMIYSVVDKLRTFDLFWMAPEVMEQLHGYDFKADIWSFGITALELAHGHAPFSKYPPMKVLLMTLQNAPPGLDYERDKKFTKSFKQMIASCLVKDPSKRPSAKKLLKHPFFKQARSNDYIARTLLEGLPALGDRMKALKRKEEDMLAQKKIPDGQKEEISQIPDEEIIGDKDQGGSTNSLSGLDIPGKQLHKFQHQFSFSSQFSDATEFDSNNPSAPPSPATQNIAYSIIKCEKSDDDLSIASSFHEPQISQNSSPCYDNRVEMNLVGKGEQAADAKLFEGMLINSRQSDKSQLQNVSSCNGASVLQTGDDAPAEAVSKHCRTSGKYRDCTWLLTSSEDFDEKTKGHVVQQRGRFKVTSENVDLEKVIPQTLAATLPLPPDATTPNLLTPSHFPVLQSILEANILQRDSILRLMRQVALGDTTVDAGCMPSNSSAVEKSQLEVAHDKEKELISEIAELQWRLIRAQEELQKYKAENVQNNS
ncbi:hypothetical protein RND71_029471 [Anisodus tanguticus]|uniref:Protein kinase domain-containing protein n=1 Tax=Anisodus tanguticus TaxID=243964 RepID=A0AAE1REL2_9SOLA|nr:hypothetical protein RND71_029471 [Anisodus tanguticus]